MSINSCLRELEFSVHTNTVGNPYVLAASVFVDFTERPIGHAVAICGRGATRAAALKSLLRAAKAMKGLKV